MAENQNGAEKTELPTPKRILDARNEGQVAQSMELSSAVMLVSGFVLLLMTGAWFCQAVFESLRYATGAGLTVELDHQQSVRELILHHLPLLWWSLPTIAGLFVVGMVVNAMQVGLHASPKALAPKWDRINPLTGFQRLFGLRGLVRLALNILKLSALMVIAWLTIRRELPYFLILPTDLGQRLSSDCQLLFWLAIAICAMLAIIAIVDLAYQRWQHIRDLMMTRQELKEEFKHSEGDPHLRSHIRQRQREIAGRRMMQEVPKADVVITNPTHVAVALRYRQGRDSAPVVVAKGYDDVAQRIKAIAAEHRIPMIEDIPLARALAREAVIGKAIPVRWYQAVAQILASLLKARVAA